MVEEIAQIIANGIVKLGDITGNWLHRHLASIIVIVFGAWVVKKFGSAIISQLLKRTVRPDLYPTKTDRDKRLRTLDGLINAVVKVAVYIIAAFLIIGEINPGYTAALFAGAGLLTVAIGFGAQSLVKDFTSGIFIILENQYRVGDVVELAGVSGTVQAVTIRTTVLRDIEGYVHHIPNGTIGYTTNKTQDFAKLFLKIGVAYDTDVDRLEHIINHVGEELAADPDFEKKIKKSPAFLRISEFENNSIQIVINGEVSPGSQWEVTGEMRKRLKKAFEKNDIDIPFPQVVIHKAKSKNS